MSRASSRRVTVSPLLRPPLAKERLTLLPDNRVRLDLKRPFGDGTYALEMDALSLLARLAASVPPPRLHLVRYSGVLAPASPWRPLVIPPLPEPAPTETPPAPQAHTKPPAKPARTGALCRYWPWAELMRLTVGLPVDTLGPARPAPAPRGFAAPVAHCGGRMKLRALVRDRESIERLPPSPGPVDRAAGPGRGTAAALLPLRNPPQADQPGRTVRVGRSAPPQGRGLPTEGSLWDRLQVKGRGFILSGCLPVQVWPSPWLQPSPFPRTSPP